MKKFLLNCLTQRSSGKRVPLLVLPALLLTFTTSGHVSAGQLTDSPPLGVSVETGPNDPSATRGISVTFDYVPRETATQDDRRVKQTVDVSFNNANLEQVLLFLKREAGYEFLVNAATARGVTGITISRRGIAVKDLLEQILRPTNLMYTINDGTIVIRPNTGAAVPALNVSIKVISAGTGQPLPGAAIMVKGESTGVITNKDGIAVLSLADKKQRTLSVSFLGMVPKEFPHFENTNITVALEEDVTSIDDVVVTGIVKRKTETFAGSATTISSAELTRVGNTNVVNSLKYLNPSVNIVQNLGAGSNPNAMPELQMRGVSSLISTDDLTAGLKGNYIRDPNAPLIILDGFETTIESIVDLDMNMIESLTLLKDASAKALYGTKAANGVLVVETKRVSGNEQRITYIGSVSVEMPDLTSYNMTNALEKLHLEKLEGQYTSNLASTQLQLDLNYNALYKKALEGLDTYWLSKPLNTGVGNKHTIQAEFGDDKSLRSNVYLSYNNIKGVMKGNDRQTIQGRVDLLYRLKDFAFLNRTTVSSVNSNESPYGYFSSYVDLNPYYANYNDDGIVNRFLDPDGYIPNPYYDGLIGTVNKNSYLQVVNNFQMEWFINRDFYIRGRFDIESKRNDADEFYPSSHSKFNSNKQYNSEELRMRKGQYTMNTGKGFSYKADLNANYTKTLGKHFFLANANLQIEERKSQEYIFTAEGFANDNIADITFAKGYLLDAIPTGQATLNRLISGLVIFSYIYNDRYLFDTNFNMSASSMYGGNKRWAPSGSVAAGWLVHKENFLKDVRAIRTLKLRASWGITGNNSLNTNETIATYKYFKNQLYDLQTGAYLYRLPNDNLKWEQTKEYNVGVDFVTDRLSMNFDWYVKDTKNMVIDYTIPTSMGFASMKENLGLVRNKGYEIMANYMILKKRAILSVNGSMAYNKNRIRKLSDAMRAYNDNVKAMAAESGSTAPSTLYEDGQSYHTIWAVRSAGIDPATGHELYIRPDGSLTYSYNTSDLVAVGESVDKYRGTLGLWGEYKGVGLSVTMSYRFGGDLYNYTIANRVENANITQNVDKRVAEGRWQTPGQVSRYKSIYLSSQTKATSRFVQRNNQLDLGQISAWYEFPTSVANKMMMKRLRFTVYMNDLYTFSSIRIERGTTNPFSRSIQFNLLATF